MEFPLTRRQTVETGLGHHSRGAAITDSGAMSVRSLVSPCTPGVPACTGRSGMATKSTLPRDCFLLAASLYQFHVEGSIFSETPIGLGQHTRDVGEAQTGSLLEKPAQRSFSEIAQLDVSFAGGFRNSAFPTGDRHGRHTESVAETLLAQLAFMTHVLDLAGPLWNNGFGISTHGLSPQKKLLSSERTRATV